MHLEVLEQRQDRVLWSSTASKVEARVESGMGDGVNMAQSRGKRTTSSVAFTALKVRTATSVLWKRGLLLLLHQKWGLEKVVILLHL